MRSSPSSATTWPTAIDSARPEWSHEHRSSSVYYTPSLTFAEYAGLSPRYSDSTVVGGASFEAHVGHAAAAIRAGLCDYAPITYGSTQRSDRGKLVSQSEWLPYEQSYAMIHPISPTGLIAHRHMHQFGTTSEQLAQVAVSARSWALRNPQAPYRTPLTVDEVLSSPVISSPLAQARLLPGHRRRCRGRAVLRGSRPRPAEPPGLRAWLRGGRQPPHVGAGPPRRPGARRAGGGARPSQPIRDHPPLVSEPGRAGRGAEAGPRERLGPRRRSVGSRRPLGRCPPARRLREGHSVDERQHQRGGDTDREVAQRVSAVAAQSRRADQPGLGATAVHADRGAGLRRAMLAARLPDSAAR